MGDGPGRSTGQLSGISYQASGLGFRVFALELSALRQRAESHKQRATGRV